LRHSVDPRLRHGSLGPLKSTPQTAFRSVPFRSVQQSAVFVRLKIVTKRPTIRPRYWVGNNNGRIYIAEANLGMFSMFGWTGAHKKGPHKRKCRII